jgi:predicted HicB family RNase H-like nuclease
MLEHKGYIGKVEFDYGTETFHGEVVSLKDVFTFEGGSVEEIRRAFRDSIDDYLEFCEERGEDPERPFTGQYRLRISSELHRSASMLSQREGTSLNEWISRSIAEKIEREKRKSHL